MAIRIPWDKYETALLIEAYQKYEAGEMTKKDAISCLSYALRERAVKNGLEIDPIFRNENGIIMQWSIISDLINKNKCRLHGGSKIFKDMVELYQSNKNEFQKILMEAKKMDECDSTIEERYLAWLSTQVSPAQMSELYLTYSEIEAFCLYIKILSKPLFETTNLHRLTKVKQTIDSNRIFRFKHKKQLKKMAAAIKYYYLWVSENQEVYSNEDYVDFKVTSVTPVQEFHQDTVVNDTESSFNNNDEISFVDFRNANSYSFTHIEYLDYFGKHTSLIKNWTQLYLLVLKHLNNDYPEIILSLCGKSIGNRGRVDISNMEGSKAMVSPKEFGNNMYIETNLSVTNIIEKIRLLLDMCKVEYENIVIAYSNKKSQVISSAELNYAVQNSNTLIGTTFYDTKKEKQENDPVINRNYVSEMNRGESFTNTYDNGIRQYDGLFDSRMDEHSNDAVFHTQGYPVDQYLQQRHFRVAANNYGNCAKDKSYITISRNEKIIDLAPYKKLLIEEYQKGFRVQSALEMKRFRNFWKKKYGSELAEDDASIRNAITQLTIQYKDHAYLPEEMLDTRIKDSLLEYISRCFSKGKKAIYYDALYKEFENDFRGQRINNHDMLKTYLAYINEGNYFINRCYLASDQNVEVDPTDEVRDYLISYGAPIPMDALYDVLSHIPMDKINWAVYGSNSDEFIRNQKGEYFHADIIDFTPSELDSFTDLIQQAINEKCFMGGNELVRLIEVKYPSIKERYPFLTPLGMRDAIGYKLREVFSFKGKIISALGQDISMTDVFADFAKSHEHFTLEQLNTLKNELETPIYFSAVYANSLRISRDTFVSKNQANFDINETDEAIDRFCTGDYITISEIRHYGSFPYAGFPWNSYLLEHYVSDFSKKYKLVHSGFNAKSAVGAIVKRTSKIEVFGELITTALADSTINLNKDDALQYLCENGFLARRSYGDIDKILDRASMLRRQRG
ncbi:hypothetical protein LNN31_10300 [Acetobacterium wieringae]|uniref:Uncharacterized protein n=1 Tax=Acetobacterium wieringae TaxID=52694 RepID=A0ABY6H9N3_9FIRM|nr:hypothetical protein [Acetobacterium wieringae]UYO61176.1 hypothetical protein LNN31_10300 [Acetobacterium wieringae]